MALKFRQLGDVGGDAPGLVAGGAAWPPRVRLSAPPAIACAHRRSASLEGTLRGLQSRVSDSAMIDKPGRRFAPPWFVEETTPDVRDANGQALAYTKSQRQT
jgi:hypothetical protein